MDRNQTIVIIVLFAFGVMALGVTAKSDDAVCIENCGARGAKFTRDGRNVSCVCGPATAGSAP